MKDIRFTADGVLCKAFVGDDGRSKYVIVKVSDNKVDLQRDIISEQVFEDVIKAAKNGEILLTPNHYTPLGFGVSVDGWTEQEKDGTISLYLMFKLKDHYGESHDLFEDIVNNRGDRYQVSVGGRILDYIHKSDPRYGVVRVITKAIVNHVAVTWAGMAVNPRTGFTEAILKALDAWEKEHSDELVLRKVNDDTAKKENNEEEEKPTEVVVFDDEEAKNIRTSEKPTLKKFQTLLDRLEVERRSIQPTLDDLEKQVERSQKWGIEISPLGFAVKPSIFAGIPDEKFADPVNYLFPVTTPEDAEVYLELWRLKPLLWKSFYLDVESAGKVFGRICQLAKEVNVSVDPNNPGVFLIPTEEVKNILPDISEEWHRFVRESILAREALYEGSLTGQLLKAEDRREEAYKKLRERARKYGYEPAPNAHLTKPAEYAHIPESQFADPVGYNYPIDKEHVLAAIRYFSKPANRNVYDPKAQKIIYERILRAMKRYGHKHRFNPDNPLDWLMPQSLKRWMVGYEKYEDEDTPEKREEMEKRLEEEYKRYNKGKKSRVEKSFEFPFENFLQYLSTPEGLELLHKLFEREAKYNYWVIHKGKLMPDEGYTEDDYADPVSYLYPITTYEEAVESLEEFLADRVYFPPHAQIFIYKRILQKMAQEKRPKAFDVDNPLDWIVAAEQPSLLAEVEKYASEVSLEKAHVLYEKLEQEYLEHKGNSVNEVIFKATLSALELVKALVLREYPELYKVLTTEGAAEGDRGIFGYWVIGQDEKKKGGKVQVPGPITYVVPIATYPKNKEKYKVTDLSQPIAVITKEAIEDLAERLQLVGVKKLDVRKASDNVVEIDAYDGSDKRIGTYRLTFGGENALLEAVVVVKGSLAKNDLPSVELAQAIKGKIEEEANQEVKVVNIGAAHVVVEVDEEGETVPYVVPLYVDDNGEIKVEWENRLKAAVVYVPEDEEWNEKLLEILYEELGEKASDAWKEYVQSLKEEEDMDEDENGDNDDELDEGGNENNEGDEENNAVSS